MAKDDRDRIRQILEGHQKKVSIKTILITAILVIAAGVAVGYYIISMKNNSSTEVSYNMKKLQKIKKGEIKPAKSVKQNGSFSLDNKTQAKKQEKKQENTVSKQIVTSKGSEIEDKTQQEEKMNNEVPKTYEVKSELQEKAQNSKPVRKKPTAGPQIVNPYKKNKAKAAEQKSNSKVSAKLNNSKTKSIEEKSKKEIAKAKKLQKKPLKKQTVKANTKLSNNKPKKQQVINKPKTKAIAKTQTNNNKQAAKSYYAVQVSSHKNKKQAQAEVDKLKKKGFSSFLISVVIDKTTYNRVMVGPYGGYFKAKNAAMSIQKQLKLNYTPMIKKYDKLP